MKKTYFIPKEIKNIIINYAYEEPPYLDELKYFIKTKKRIMRLNFHSIRIVRLMMKLDLLFYFLF